MTPPPPPSNDETTAVSVVFKKGSTVLPNISAYLYDERNSVTIKINGDDNKTTYTLTIDSRDESSNQHLPITLKPGQHVIDSSIYEFSDRLPYVFKMMVTQNKQTYYSYFSHGVEESNQNTQSYSFFYREDGGDVFSEDSAVLNPNEIENNSPIIISAPVIDPQVISLTKELNVLQGELANLNESSEEYTAKEEEIAAKQAAIEQVEDTRKPHTVMFSFDEVDNYIGVANDSDNTEQIVNYSPVFEYAESGEYHLENNQLVNGRSYLVKVIGIYSDGEVIHKKLNDKVNVITAPVIHNITGYGLGADPTDPSNDAVSTVMEIKITAASSPDNIAAVNNQIKFNFKQSGELIYSATKEVIPVSDAVNGNIIYRVLTEDMSQPQSPPTQNEDKSYTYDVTAVLEYSLEEGSATIVKTSNSVSKDFKDDIIPIAEVTILNAWIAASVTIVHDERVVNLDDGRSAQGYQNAPVTAIAGQFSKHDYFGSGKTTGFIKDLDFIDTKFKFEMSVNEGEWQPVQNLHIILGAVNASDQQNYVNLMSEEMQSNPDGLYSNPDVPDELKTPTRVPGSQQPDIYFMVCGPPQNPYQQDDSIQVRVQIITPEGETTIPSPTESNENIVMNKVIKYIMEKKTSSEPKFIGSGDDSVLLIPINNVTNQDYLDSVTFKSDLEEPNDSITQTVTDKDGVFDVNVFNPSARGVNEQMKYTVYYTLSDPNTDTTIRGPVSIEYTISVSDEPVNENFTISNFDYNTFHGENESSFEFKVSFQDVDSTSINGINVYFKSDNDDENSSNNIPETLVATVSRYNSDESEHDENELIKVTLQTEGPSTSSATDGVKVLDKSGNSSNQIWKNYRSGTIVFRPYIESGNEVNEVSGVYDEEVINNFPVFDPVDPEFVSLTGGVIQSYQGTQVSWTNDLTEKYGSVSNVDASHELSVNSQDQTENINGDSDSYHVNISGAASTYTVDIKVKIVAVNGDVFYSESTTVVFDSVSVQTSSLNVTVARGSNHSVFKASYQPLVVDDGDDDNLVVTSVEIVDNEDPDNNVDPEGEAVVVLICTSTDANIKPATTVHTHDISSYQLGDDIDAVVRVEAGVKYTVNDGESQNSIPLYLTLSAAENYVVAKKPSVNVADTYVVVNNELKITLNINANGLWNEGLQGCFVLLTQDGDFTDEVDADPKGALATLHFDSTQFLNTYETQVPANAEPESIDNMATGEPFELTDENGTTYNLTLNTLNSDDKSVLTVPANAGFDFTKPLMVIAVASTRLGLNSNIKGIEVVGPEQ